MKTLYWHPTGPKISYERDILKEKGYQAFLTVEDLNPENRIHFCMTPIELFFFGFRCIWASIWP